MRGSEGKRFREKGTRLRPPGGAWTIPEVQKFAKTRLRRTKSDHSQPTSWYEMGHNSEKLLGFGALHFHLLAPKSYKTGVMLPRPPIRDPSPSRNDSKTVSWWPSPFSPIAPQHAPVPCHPQGGCETAFWWFHMRLCFYVIPWFVRPLPGRRRYTDLGIKSPPAM